MLGVGVLLYMCDYTHQVYSVSTKIQQWDYKPAVPEILSFSLCLLCVSGSVFEKADPGRLSETFGLSVERLNGRTDVLNVTLPFLFVFVVVS
jgi:hypothetical protein